jgi:hypothetical protein
MYNFTHFFERVDVLSSAKGTRFGLDGASSGAAARIAQTASGTRGMPSLSSELAR